MTITATPVVPPMPARPAPFPHHYSVELGWSPGEAGLLTAQRNPPLPGGAPPDFGGREDWWSPEDLLLSAVALCFQTTFHAFAARAALPVARLEARCEGVLEKTKDGLRFTRFVLKVRLAVPAADAARARELAEASEKNCLVSRALVVPVELELEIEPLA
jgi:organic hydroperoxide reductase OsmC/OhrA